MNLISVLLNRRYMGMNGTAMILIMALANPFFTGLVQGQPAEGPGASGTIVGPVKETTDEYILLRQPDGSPLRYWFKWIEANNAVTNKDLESAVLKFKAGDTLEIRWTFDDRTRIEAVKLVSAATEETAKPEPPKDAAPPPPSAAPTNAAPSEPASTPSHKPTAVAPTAEFVNGLIDRLVAGGGRLLELPLYMFLAGIGLAGLVLALASWRWFGKGNRSRMAGVLLVAEAALCLFAVAFVMDRKIARLQTAVTELRSKSTADAAALLGAVSKLESRRRSFLCDPLEVQKNLAGQLGEVNLQPLIYDEATDFIRIHFKRPLTHAFMAMVDLRHPKLEIKFGATLDKKRLTSAFARETDCSVAINGEAGESPAPNSGLGDWKGNFVHLGHVLLRENAKFPAPFLSFDPQNHASFTASTATNRTLAPQSYNVIWGRWDALINGVAQAGDAGNRQPRTAMGINQDGTMLYLLVVDGRQPNYSNGLTRIAVGQCLKAFGAYQGMMCDEGGSSCIYLKQFGGIANIPADNNGQERSTYTHFGIRLRVDK